jgi:hypothetical protein
MNNDKIFIDWVKENNIKRIDRDRQRHPVMFSIRKYADDKIVEMYKSHTGIKNNYSSIFSEDAPINPSIIDKALFKFDNYFKLSKEKLTNFKDSTQLYYSEFNKKYYQPLFEKLDETYYKVQNLKVEVIEKKNLQFFNGFSKKFLHRNLNEYEKLFYEREQISKKIIIESFKNRFYGFWRVSVGIRKNYIIDLDSEKFKKKTDNYISVPRKVLSIIKSKYFPSFKFTKGLLFKSLFAVSYLLIIKFRYEYYEQNLFKEIKESEELIETLIKEPNLLVKIESIFDEETEKKYHDIIVKDKLLKMLTPAEFDKIDEFGDSQDINSSYKFLLNSINARASVFNLIKIFTPMIYAVFKLKKGLSKSKILFNSAVMYFLINEIFINLSFGDYINLKNYTATFILKSDMNEFMKFSFYRNNLNKIYSMKN